MVLTLLARFRARPPRLPVPSAAERQIPRQLDYASRLEAATVRARERGADLTRSAVDRALLGGGRDGPERPLPIDSRATWLLRAPFTYVMGGGLMGMFEHFGRIRALDRLGICPRDLIGISSGAVIGAMVATMPLDSVEQELSRLSIVDFLDPSWTSAWAGALCEGNAMRSTLSRMLERHGRTTFEATSPPLSVAVYSLSVGCTRLVSAGPLVPTVYQSAALPLLFAPFAEHIDGGWMDDQGRLWLQPGQRALQSRLPTGYDDEPTDWFTAPLRRERPVYALSENPEHLSLLVEIDERLRAPWFMFEVDGDPAKARYLVEASYEATLRWLLSPAAVP